MVSFLQLLLLVGLPRIPDTNIPFAVIIIIINYKTIIGIHKKHTRKLFYFYMWVVLFFILGVFLSEETIDLIFYGTLIIKLLIAFFAGVISAKLIFKNNSIIYYWLAVQSFFSIITTVNKPVFDALLIFVPKTSIDTIGNIFSLRGLGFGIYHAEGAVIFAIMAMLPLVLSMKKPRVFFRPFVKIITPIAFVSSLLLARSALIPIAIYYLFKNFYGVIKLALVVFTIGYATTYIPPEQEVFYEATELFRNLYQEQKFQTKSTDANLNMIKLPSTFEGYLFGHGRFFENAVGFTSGFYKKIDIGWLRLLFFGGVMVVVPFFFLNIFWFVRRPCSYFAQKNFSLILVFIFAVVNLKGIFIFSYAFSLYYFYDYYSKSAYLNKNQLLNNNTIEKMKS